MFTAAATRSLLTPPTVVSRQELSACGVTRHQLTANIAAHRWQRIGRAIVLHNGALLRHERFDVARINCGPRAVLTAFTALEVSGLSGWTREDVHVLAPAGTRAPKLPGIRVRLHLTNSWDESDFLTGRDLHRPAPALVRAAGSLPNPRHACGILVAGVQQRLVHPGHLRLALDSATRTRHRSQLLATVGDVEQGADALSEIDFVRLCRRFRLPAPVQQEVRREPSGRRRYLDASWRRRDGRLVVAEVDGAVHLGQRAWWADQLRQNEIVIADSLVLRFPTVVVRVEQQLVADQLRRALWL